MPIGIITQRNTDTGSIPNISRTVKMGIVGISLGKSTLTSNEVTWLSSSDGTKDTLSATTVKTISRVSPNQNDFVTVYKEGLDWELEAPNKINWLNNLMSPPELEGYAVAGITVNTFASAPYNYKIVALGTDGTTAPSSAVAINNDTTSYHRLEWTKVDFATGYAIYDSTANQLITLITNPDTVYYERKTIGTPVSATIPTTGTAVRRPDTDSTYFVDYTYTSYDTDATLYSSNELNLIEQTYGTGSDIVNMARILFDNIGIPELWVVGTDGTTNAKFIAGIEQFDLTSDIQYVVALKDSTTVQNYVASKAEINSRDTEMKERFGVVAVSNGETLVGDANSGVRKQVLAFAGNKRAIVVVPNNNKVYMDIWQETDGSYTDNKEVGNHFLAGAVAGLRVVAPNVAYSIIGKTISGFNYGTYGKWNDNVVKNYFETDGATYIQNVNGVLKVYNDNTNSQGILEDRETTVLSGEDEMRRQLRSGVDVYPGRPITDGLVSSVYSRVKDILDDLIGDNIIKSYSGLSISINSTEKVTIDILFDYYPLYPLKQIRFKYSFSVS